MIVRIDSFLQKGLYFLSNHKNRLVIWNNMLKFLLPQIPAKHGLSQGNCVTTNVSLWNLLLTIEKTNIRLLKSVNFVIAEDLEEEFVRGTGPRNKM